MRVECKNMNYKIEIKKYHFRLIFISLIFCFISSLFSCIKKEKPTIVLINVRQTNGVGVENVNVRLYGVPNNSSISGANIAIDVYSTTNSSGVASFDLSSFYNTGQTGFAVLNIYAEKMGVFSEGYIEVEGEQTNETIITFP